MTKCPTVASLVCLVARLDGADGIRSAMVLCACCRRQEAGWEWDEDQPDGLRDMRKTSAAGLIVMYTWDRCCAAQVGIGNERVERRLDRRERGDGRGQYAGRWCRRALGVDGAACCLGQRDGGGRYPIGWGRLPWLPRVADGKRGRDGRARASFSFVRTLECRMVCGQAERGRGVETKSG